MTYLNHEISGPDYLSAGADPRSRLLAEPAGQEHLYMRC